MSMKHVPTLITAIIILFSCNHPESKIYERNQGLGKDTYNDGQGDKPTYEYDKLHAFKNSEKKNSVKMEFESGVKFIWIEINGIKLRFIFDTGASSICISSAEATVLYRQGTLREEDILNVELFQDATGRISEGTIINLREVKIGNMLLENVKALVVKNVNAPLLLGQTVLERFGSIEIDNANQEIIFR